MIFGVSKFFEAHSNVLDRTQNRIRETNKESTQRIDIESNRKSKRILKSFPNRQFCMAALWIAQEKTILKAQCFESDRLKLQTENFEFMNQPNYRSRLPFAKVWRLFQQSFEFQANRFQHTCQHLKTSESGVLNQQRIRSSDNDIGIIGQKIFIIEKVLSFQ